MVREEKVNLLNELLGIEEKNDIGNLTSTDRREFQQWVEDLEHETCEDEYIKVPKKALKYRTAGMVAYNAEWLKDHFDIERAVICGAQQPSENAISRQAAKGNLIHAIRWNDMPKKEVLEVVVKALEQQPCENAISRQAVLDLVVANHRELNGVNVVMYSPLCKDIKQLPSVTPQQKIGKWIINGSEYSETYSYKLNCSCSVCGYKAVFYDHISSIEPCLENANCVHKFCPNCGFRMIESQESVGNPDRFGSEGV